MSKGSQIKDPTSKRSFSAAAKGSSTAAAKRPAAKAATKAPAKKAFTLVKPKNEKGVYTQSEFIENLVGYCGLTTKSEAKAIIDGIGELLVDALKKGYKVPLFGTGKLFVRKTKARMGRNPSTQEPIKIPASKKVKFNPSKVLKDAVS